jgi:hypothetical protein
MTQDWFEQVMKPPAEHRHEVAYHERQRHVLQDAFLDNASQPGEHRNSSTKAELVLAAPTLVAYMNFPASICADVPCGVPGLASTLGSTLSSCFTGAADAAPFCADVGGVLLPAAASSFTT